MFKITRPKRKVNYLVVVLANKLNLKDGAAGESEIDKVPLSFCDKKRVMFMFSESLTEVGQSYDGSCESDIKRKL